MKIEEAAASRRVDPQQVIKWTVYSLLLLNWALYIQDDWQNAQHTLRTGGSLLDWTSAFGTSLDLAAWFGLLFLWELETYALPEEAWTRFTRVLFLAIRGVCYVVLAHTVVSRAVTWTDLHNVEPAAATGLCQLAGQEISWANNLEYTLVDEGNCVTLGGGGPLYFVDNSAVTDSAGLAIERRSAWIDLQDAVAWLLVMFTIELGIWMQERGVTGGPLLMVRHIGKGFYALLLAHGVYWAWMGHWLFTWDQLLWIGGFWAIEFNIKEWRDDLLAKLQKNRPGAAAWDKIPADSS